MSASAPFVEISADELLDVAQSSTVLPLRSPSIVVTTRDEPIVPVFGLGLLHQILATYQRQGRRVTLGLPLGGSNLEHELRWIVGTHDPSAQLPRQDAWARHRWLETLRLEQIADLRPDVSAQHEGLFNADPRVFAVRLEDATKTLFTPEPHLRAAVTRLAKEAVDNVRIHATESVSDRTIIADNHALVMLRLIDLSTAPQPTVAGLDSQWRDWNVGWDTLLDLRRSTDKRVLEVTVSDGGDGIPATFEGTMAIYQGPIEIELTRIGKALLPRQTSELARPFRSSHQRKGFGFQDMVDALATVKGFLFIASGRCRLSFSAISRDGRSKPVNLTELSVHAWDREACELRSGTVLTALMPLSGPTLLDP